MTERSNLNILIIDDNPDIHKDFIKILTRDCSNENILGAVEKKIFGDDASSETKNSVLPNFCIKTATQGKEGVQFIAEALKQNQHYALAFVDIRMPPGLDGIETIKRIWEIDPDIQIVICTAFSDYSWDETVAELGQKENLLILKKPFDSVAVRQLACALTKKWQLMQSSRNYTIKLKEEVENRTASLKESLSRVRATLESSNDGILVIDNHQKIVDHNSKFLNMWHVPHTLINRKNFAELCVFMQKKTIEDDPFFHQLCHLDADSEDINIGVIKFWDGQIFEYYTQQQKVEDEAVGRVFAFRDITKKAKLEEKLEFQATHDSLTGLPNRVLLLERIRQLIKSAKANSSRLAILFIDLDRFKLINDSLSHAYGDDVLRVIASRLQEALSEEDTIARLGGDEFVIAIKNFDDQSLVNQINKIQQSVQLPIVLDNRPLLITASIGISICPSDGNSADILLRNADAAMYRAKEKLGNNHQFYTAKLNIENLDKLEKESQLRCALANNEFFLCYQPEIDLKTGKIIAAEALLRWNNPQKGILLPIDFIPIAEATGLIVPIGEWVLRNACRQNKAWQDAGLPPIRVAVNITAQQFIHQDLVKLVGQVLNETQLNPKYLELEMTENVIISTAEIIKALVDVKKLGVTIAIDDFGTGYSSLSYLKKIPLDRLKIDASFVKHIQSGSDDEVVIRAVISIAKNLNLEVLAEGVENQSQVDFLKLHECGNVQGFYFSKPLTADEMSTFLKNSENVTTALAETNE